MGKIAFFPLLSGMGHCNIGLSISKRIFEKYGDKHEIYFIVNKSFAEKINKICPQIKCETYRHPLIDKNENSNEAEYLQEMFEIVGPKLQIEDRVEFVNQLAEDEYEFLETNQAIYDEVTQILKRIKVDFFIFDQIQASPIGIDQGIPYAMLMSCAITFLGYHQLPPLQSGLPTEYTPENVKLWNEFIDKTYKTGKNKELHDLINQWLKEHNCLNNLDDYYHHNCPSPYLNIYNYPDCIDYQNDKVKLPGKWVKIQSAILPPLPPPFEIPEKLAKLNNSKLIYVSVGSFSSSYLPLMTHIVNVIKELPYRFILSAGNSLDKLELAENIYSEKFLPQLAVLQSVDLFISHGGNNSFTEAFYIGLPQIVLPLFADQIENATRISDKGLGSKLNPFKMTKEQLGQEIEKFTTPEIKDKYKEISAKIRSNTYIDDVIENILSFCK